MSLDKYELVRTHWIRLPINSDKVAYFGSFGVEYTPREVETS